MDETRLLIFRCGGEEYGVLIEDVAGVIGGAKESEMSKASPAVDAAIPCNNREGKSVIFMNSGGVQIALLVDEIITVMKLRQADEAVGDTTIADFKVWRLGNGIAGDLETWNPFPEKLSE
jgi:chemotaxis signal transduction protein